MTATTSQPAWAPDIPDLDGSPISTFPRVFYSQSELDLARKRAASEKWAIELNGNLVKDADEALNLELQPLDERWWKAASTRPWEQTYPEIAEHTQRKPMRFAHASAICAMAWRLTGETRYADRACDLLLLLAPYQFEPQHFDVGLNYSTWGYELLRAYDLVGQRLAPAERREVDRCMTRLARAVMKNDVYWIEHDIGGGINNHLAWHKMMLGLLGLFYGRPELVRFCLDGPRGMLPLLGDGLVDHGLWCESSLNYHFTAIWPMILFADAQRRMDSRPCLFEMQTTNGRALEQACSAMIDVLFPDGSIPPVGDAYGHRAVLFDSPLYEYAWSGWHDRRFAWLLSQSNKRTLQALFTPDLPQDLQAPSVRSLLLPEHGYVFLRDNPGPDYWNSSARCLFMTYGRTGVHSNADKLSIMLFGEKKLLLADREALAGAPHAFSSQVQRELNRSTICHNTVMIDERDQLPIDRSLRLIEYHVTPTERRISVADLSGQLYAGVRQMRTTILAPEYVLDVFQVDGGSSQHQIDWIAHPFEAASELMINSVPLSAASRPYHLPAGLPWSWLGDARQLDCSFPAQFAWTSDELRFRLYLLTSKQAAAVTCGFPATDARQPPLRSVLLIRQRAASATIVAIWTADGAPCVVHAIEAAGSDLRYRVEWSGGAGEHTVPKLTGLRG